MRILNYIFFVCFSGFFLASSSYAQDDLKSLVSFLTIDEPENSRMERMIDHALELKNQNFQLAQQLLDTVVIISDKKGLEMQHARALTTAAILAKLNNQSDLMVSRYLEAIAAYEDFSKIANDTLKPIISVNVSVCYNNMAEAYSDKGDYGMALDFYKNSLKEVISLNDSLGISIRCYNISNTFLLMNQYDSAFKYIYWSKDLETGMRSDEGLAYAHEGLAKIYNQKESFLNALQHIDSALTFVEIIGDEFFRLDIVEMKGEILTSIGGLEQAIETFELGILKSKKVGYRRFTINAYEKLGQLYYNMGNYKKAYTSISEYNKYKSEVEEEETAKKIEEFQILYKSEQKDQEIANLAMQNQLKEEANQNLLARQEAEKSANRIIYIALSSGVVLLGFIGLLLFRASQRRKRVNDFLRTTNENLKLKNEKIESQAKQIADSISYARNIQNAILPLDSELARTITEHFVYYAPKDIVSGDFYWYYEMEGKRKALLAVADCTGHGVPGAFMSIVGHALLEKIVKQLGIYDTNKILDQLGYELNNTLQKGGESDVKDGMDIAIISIDLDNSIVEYSGARNQLLFVANGELTEFKGDRIDLGKGKKAEKSFTKHQITFSKGDCFYMFTDGYVDQKGGAEGKKFFMPPFRDLLNEIAGLPVDQQKEILKNKFKDWKGTQFEQMDDVLVMGIKL